MTPDNAKVEAALGVLRVAAASIRSGAFAASATAHNIEQALATLTAALAERERDAGRYRWSREAIGAKVSHWFFTEGGDALDAAIDAAMQGESHD